MSDPAQVGFKGPRSILAIDTDREAPIMAKSDHALVGDLGEVPPPVMAELRQVLQRKLTLQ